MWNNNNILYVLMLSSTWNLNIYYILMIWISFYKKKYDKWVIFCYNEIEFCVGKWYTKWVTVNFKFSTVSLSYLIMNFDVTDTENWWL